MAESGRRDGKAADGAGGDRIRRRGTFTLLEREESVCVALRGRGVPEKVTSGSSFAASAGPIPLTRVRFATAPNAPRCTRSSTMRRASTGPTPGSASNCSAVATSTSTGDDCVGDGGREGADAEVSTRARRLLGRRLLPRSLPCRRAESTATSWPSSARNDAGGTRSMAPATRRSRTDAPSNATAARKRSAFFSAGVGMARR